MTISPTVFPRLFLSALLAAILLSVASISMAQPPAGYYSGVTAFGNPALLRQQIHNAIQNHTRRPYASNNAYMEVLDTDQSPGRSGFVVDIYRNESFAKLGDFSGGYNREHTWPNSYGLNNGSGHGTYPYADLHHLFVSDSSYNTIRGNRPWAHFFSPSGLTEQVTLTSNGRGGAGGTPFPGDSNWYASGTPGRWMVWSGRKGDVARAALYMDVRYDGTPHSDSTEEIDLILTDDPALIGTVDLVSSPKRAWMGELTTIIRWHLEDPVDSLEIRRNNLIHDASGQGIATSQGNRNPFIDNPTWAGLVWGYAGAPEQPTGLLATAGNATVDLTWNANSDLDIAGYDVYRSTTSASTGFIKLNSALVAIPAYTDTGLSNGTTYWYRVVAVDLESPANESSQSSAAEATPVASLNNVLIVGISTRNSTSATHEWAALANSGSTAVNLTGWRLISRTATADSTINLTGSIPARGHYIIGSNPYGGTVEGVIANLTTTNGLFGSGISDTTARSFGLYNAANELVDAFSIGAGASTPYSDEDGLYAFGQNTGNTTQSAANSIFRKRPGGTVGAYQDTDRNVDDLEIRPTKVPPSDVAVPVGLTGIALH